MESITMDESLLKYIFSNYSYYRTEKEKLAYRHHFGLIKLKNRPTSWADSSYYKDYLTTDPEVLQLLEDGYEAFVTRTAQRIYQQHQEKIRINSCPACSKIAQKPKQTLCRYCGYNWR